MHMSTRRLWGLGALLMLGAVVVVFTAFASAASGSAQHVRWDITILVGGGPPGPALPGGSDSATAANGGGTITLTGTGTFVAPAGGGGSNAVTGGGNWTTSAPYAGSGTYEVVELLDWELANLQAPPPVIVDGIGDANNKPANGNAVMRIEFSDGSQGVLTVGCHGPGAPAGIFEGIAVTKGSTTYYTTPAPVPGDPLGRTLFHVRV
jgi:hypothetical protein